MTETEATEILRTHLPEAIDFAFQDAPNHSCELRGDCHAILVVDPSADLHGALRAFCRQAFEPTDVYYAAIATAAIATLFQMRGMDTDFLYAAVDAMAAEETLVIGVVGEYSLTTRVVVRRAVGQA